jgi:DHA1 family bicyclomycin/chloramphenicol resistance-like MFS transporter
MVALYSWRLIFVFLLLFGMVCMALAWFNLPESLPPERRQSLHLGHVLKVYARLLLHPPFIVPGAVGGLASSGLFAYITGSAFVFIQHLGLSTQRYGALFGLVALGLIASAQLNRLALRHWTPARILGWGLTANVVAGAALLLVAGHGGLIAILIPLWLAICTLGFVGPNAAAGAMIASGEHAGSGSALIGVLQFSCASAASGAVAGMQNGTAYPMAIVIAVAGLSGALLWWLCGRSEGLRRPPLQHRA